jgi:two-component system, NtrC family, response regulator AtoC
MKQPQILIVDDDADLLRYCRTALEPTGAVLLVGDSVGQGLEVLRQESIDLLLTDLELPDGTGLDLLKAAHDKDPGLVVSVITGKGTIQSAIEAMKQGAFDYLLKPLPPAELRAHVRKALEHRALVVENRNLRQKLADALEQRKILGQSPGIREMLRTIDKAAPYNTTVLVTGETGTGKELVARTLHEKSPRREGPFVGVNCSALPETLLESELFGHQRGAFTGASASRKGVFAQADRGTLLLDEIGTMPAGLQAKLLRTLEEGTIRPLGAEKEIPVDVRVVAATNADLSQLMKQGEFREDLFFRLNVLSIRVPPLRERREDIPLLARHFIERNCEGEPLPELQEETLDLLQQAPWPGNVRQLANVIERACLLCDGEWILPKDLPEGLLDAPEPKPGGGETGAEEIIPLAEVEKGVIERALESTGWQRSKTAELLGISRRTLYNKIREYNLSPGA